MRETKAATALVVERLLKKRELLRAGDPEHNSIQLLLIAGPGGIRGAFGIGVMYGFERSGLSDCFDVAIGVSAGAPNVGYLLSRQASTAVSVYTDDLTDRRFSNLLRPRMIVDVDYLDHVLRSVKPLDRDTVRKSRTRFYIGATSLSGEGMLVDVKTFSDILLPIKASMALPILYNRPVVLGNVPVLDGGASLPIPLREGIGRFSPTDILIVTNYPVDNPLGPMPLLERLMAGWYLRKFPKAFQQNFLGRYKRYDEALETVFSSGGNLGGVNVGVIAPPKEASIGRFSYDRVTVQKLARVGAQTILDLCMPGATPEF